MFTAETQRPQRTAQERNRHLDPSAPLGTGTLGAGRWTRMDANSQETTGTAVLSFGLGA